jgi:hypothetical protein
LRSSWLYTWEVILRVPYDVVSVATFRRLGLPKRAFHPRKVRLWSLVFETEESHWNVR